MDIVVVGYNYSICSCILKQELYVYRTVVTWCVLQQEYVYVILYTLVNQIIVVVVFITDCHSCQSCHSCGFLLKALCIQTGFEWLLFLPRSAVAVLQTGASYCLHYCSYARNSAPILLLLHIRSCLCYTATVLLLYYTVCLWEIKSY